MRICPSNEDFQATPTEASFGGPHDLSLGTAILEGGITHAEGAVTLSDCQVKTGDVLALKGIRLVQTWCAGDVSSQSAFLDIVESSAVEGNAEASQALYLEESVVGGSLRSIRGDIHVKEGYVFGDILSDSGEVHIQNSECLSKRIKAAGSLTIEGGVLSPQATISSRLAGVTISMPEGECSKVTKVSAETWVALNNVSSEEVRAGWGIAVCRDGQMGFVQSACDPILERSKVDKLELWHLLGTDTCVDMQDSRIKNVTIKVLSGMEGAPATIGRHAPVQHSALGTVRFIGGSILGDITCIGDVDLDLSETRFSGEVWQAQE